MNINNIARPYHRNIALAAVILAIPALWVCVVQYGGERIHENALAGSSSTVAPAIPPPVPSDNRPVWVAGHMQRGKWVEGYWRRARGR